MFTVTTVLHKTSDTAHPLVMLTNREGSRYFFGKIPEGTQRVLNENRIRLGKLKSIFITGTASSWSELGGLPGLFLTISDSTKKSIDVFCGSSFLTYIVATWRYFVFRKGVELKVLDVKEEDTISDSNLNVIPVKVRPAAAPAAPAAADAADAAAAAKAKSMLDKLTSLMFPMDTSDVNSDDPSSYKSDPSENEIHTHVRLPGPETLCPLQCEPSTSYLVDFVPIRGKFDSKKAIQLGIKPGPNFRKLTEGESIQNDKGEWIHTNQVVGPSKSFSKLLILDIPDKSYLTPTIEKLVESTSGSGSVAGGSIDPNIQLVYHFLADNVDFAGDEYVRFINSFDKNCTHVFSHKSVSLDSIVFKTSAINVLKLKSLQSDCFNLPAFQAEAPETRLPTTNSHALGPAQVFNIQPVEINNEQKLSQVFQEDTAADGAAAASWSSLYDTHVAPLTSNASKAETIDETPISLGTVEGDLKDQVQVMTLGTGSALPSMQRNVISTLVRVPYVHGSEGSDAKEIKFRSMLLDAGENTVGTMMRNFGHNNQDQFVQVFKELGLIYLSHLHADHHLGIVSIVKKWFEINTDPAKRLYLVTPWQYDNFITEWFRLENGTKHGEENLVDFSRLTYLSCEDFLRAEQPQGEFKQFTVEEFEEEFERKCKPNYTKKRIPRLPVKTPDLDSIGQLYKDFGVESIATCRAIHCHWAYSVTINLQMNPAGTECFKVSYSGDTRPNIKFAEIGYGSDLLIHESSLAEDHIEEALAKKHSTMIEAVTMSKLMRCPKIILTHFSTRYSNTADLPIEPTQLREIATRLKEYFFQNGVGKRNGGNILLYDDELSTKSDKFDPANSHTLGFDDLQMCYAFDMMTIRYSNLQSAKFNYTEMLKMFETEELNNYIGDVESLNLKKERELEKQREKREAKRDQRLGKKKRRTSDESERSLTPPKA